MFHVKQIKIFLYLKPVFFSCLFLLQISCSSSGIRQPETSREEVADLKEISQNLMDYLSDPKNDPVILPEFYKNLKSYYLSQHFSPWKEPSPNQSRESIRGWWLSLLKKDYYGENKQKISINVMQKLIQETDWDHYPSLNRKAVTVRNTFLRILPTEKPFFGDFQEAGQGYPFDLFQVSAVWGNTPLKISHLSKDGSWAYAKSPFASGWLPVCDFAWINEEQAVFWMNAARDWVVFSQDQIPLRDLQGNFLYYSRLGTLFPIDRETSGKLILLAFSSGENQEAVTRQIEMDPGAGAKNFLFPKRSLIAAVGNTLLGKNYGWGGLYENRDCSSTLKDLFSVFGIWLPRNSYYQYRAGASFSLEGLSNSDKEKMILRNGIPFFTLVWLKGHIMLYIGKDSRGRALVFHNVWGIHTRDNQGNPGRKIIGKTVITTLEPGKELPEVKETLLSRVLGMTHLIPSYSVQKMAVGKDPCEYSAQ